MPAKESLLLGEMLVQRGLITNEQLEIALREQRKTGQFLGTTLVRLKFLTDEQMLPVLSEQLSIGYVKIDQIRVEPSVIEKIPAKFACHYTLMPLKIEEGSLTVAVTDPMDIHTIDDLKLLLKYEIKVLLAGEKDIMEAIKKYYGIGAETIEKIIDETAKKEVLTVTTPAAEDIEDMAEDASIIKFVNQILLEAYQDKATDIHIEPFENELRVRYRVDGVLYDAAIPPTIKYFQSAIVSRIKIMAGLNIAERRLPQDGRIKVRIGEGDLDLRVSILPTAYGESVDIRILSSAMLYSLEELGLSKQDLAILEQIIKRPHGIIFVTGPTGSGKTTTLYACLSKINDATKKIITIEDPIEYQLRGITQIQIMPKIGLTFAQGLRSMLRHDPDIMMVGEVRDYETAEITIRVALTGHLVFSTLHTNDAAGAVSRLLDMGVESFLAASSVECIIAQRLVRLICPKCKTKVKRKEEVLRELGSEVDWKTMDLSKVEIFEGRGCENCKFTGYKGRTAIYEFLVVNDKIRELILKRTSADQIKKKALELGMRTLRRDGMDKVLKGLTTIGEVVRVSEAQEVL